MQSRLPQPEDGGGGGLHVGMASLRLGNTDQIDLLRSSLEGGGGTAANVSPRRLQESAGYFSARVEAAKKQATKNAEEIKVHRAHLDDVIATRKRQREAL